LVDDPHAEARPIDETRDLGFMLYDLDYSDENNPRAAFWRPHMIRGVIEVPAWESNEVRK
jgi:CRISPR-associated protein Cas5d